MGTLHTQGAVRFLVVILLPLLVPTLPALDTAVLSRLPPDDSDIRRDFADYASAPLVELYRLREVTRRSRVSGRDVRISVEQSDEFAYFVVVPERDGEFALDTAGTYILRRRRDNGRISQLKIFLRSSPEFFVRVQPVRDDLSVMTVVLGGVPAYQDVPVPLGIPAVMEAPLGELLEVTGGMVDWSLVYPVWSRAEYKPVEIMVSRARSTLNTLPDAEDGAMDENGQLVFIESLVLQDQQPGFNCSGFAKWIVDGLSMGLYGHYLAIDPLKAKHTELRGHRWSDPREDDRDPYFGLDWTRNLASAMLSAERGEGTVDPEESDVRNVPFVTYVEDVGYPVERLKQIMYLLAVEEPGNFYLGSINREFGRDPQLHQHVHVVVLFPYFDSGGHFRVVVMERNVESSVASLDVRYHDDNIHLVRIRASAAYVPPLIRR